MKPSDYSITLETSDRDDYPAMLVISDHYGCPLGICYGRDVHDAMDRFYRLLGISRKG